ncbi:MAG: hypothetical protein QM804_06090 [Propionicimonas sp.]
MTLRWLFGAIRAHWVMVITCSVLGAVAGLAIAVALPKSYVATGHLLVRWIGSTSSVADYTQAKYAADRAKTYAVLVEQPEVLNATIDELGLDLSAAGLRNIARTENPTGSAEILVKVTYTDPEQAARIATELSRQISLEITREEQVAGRRPAVDAQVVVQPRVPTAPSSPETRLLVASGLLLALGLGVVVVQFSSWVRVRRTPRPPVRLPAAAPADSPWRLPKVKVGAPHVVFAMLLAATIPWRKDALYEGGADPVVYAKAAISVAAAVFAAGLVYRRRKSLYSVPAMPLLVLLAYLAVTVVGGLANQTLQPAAVIAVRALILAVTVCLLTACYGARETIRALVTVFAAITVIATLTGVLSFDSGRLGGGFPPLKPNALAFLTSVLILWLVARIFSGTDSKFQNVLPFVLLAILLLTGSRTSLVAMAVAVLVMAFRMTAVRRRTILMGLIALPVVVYVALGTDVLSSVLLRGGEEQVSTLSNRTIAWNSALTMERSFWQTWFGQGLSQKMIEVPGQWWDTQLLDSSWISALVQGGYLGLFFVVGFAAMTLARAAFAPRREGSLWLGLTVLVTVRGFLESGLFDSSTAFLVLVVTSLGARSSARTFPTLASEDQVFGRSRRVARRAITGGIVGNDNDKYTEAAVRLA